MHYLRRKSSSSTSWIQPISILHTYVIGSSHHFLGIHNFHFSCGGYYRSCSFQKMFLLVVSAMFSLWLLTYLFYGLLIYELPHILEISFLFIQWFFYLFQNILFQTFCCEETFLIIKYQRPPFMCWYWIFKVKLERLFRYNQIFKSIQ